MDVPPQSLGGACSSFSCPDTPFGVDLRQARSLAGISFLNGVAAVNLPTARRQFSNQFERKPWGITGVILDARHCFVRLACLPLRSILALGQHPCFSRIK